MPLAYKNDFETDFTHSIVSFQPKCSFAGNNKTDFVKQKSIMLISRLSAGQFV